MLLDLHDEIDNKVNPLSDDNIDTWNATVSTFQNDTAIGQVFTIVHDYGNDIVTSFQSVSPISHLYVNTIGVNFFGAEIPASTIDIDFSWYAPYRVQCFTIMRAFIIFSYIVLLIRNAPSILGGVAPLLDSTSNSFNDVTIDENGVVLSATTHYREGNNYYHIKR